jgi:RNA polymerase sigma-70 factor, ECF subfamily
MRSDRLDQLYRSYAPVIYARCRRILQDRAAAEDATHETFVRVARHLDRAPDAGDALTWIYRIATNYCLSVLRDTKARAEPMAILPEWAGHHPEAPLLDALAATALLARLPEKVRPVVWLHRVEGMEQEEVARVLGISRRSVVNRLAEFRERVERMMAKEEA